MFWKERTTKESQNQLKLQAFNCEFIEYITRLDVFKSSHPQENTKSRFSFFYIMSF